MHAPVMAPVIEVGLMASFNPFLIPSTHRYVSFGGLSNQVYGHTNAMTLAASLGASIIIPPSVVRNGFDKIYSRQADRNQLLYTYSPFGDLFNEAKIIKHLEGGMQPCYSGSWRLRLGRVRLCYIVYVRGLHV